MADSDLGRLIALVARHAQRHPSGGIKSDTTILHDLRIMGDDADELGWAIELQFGIDFHDHELGMFLPSEGFILSFRGGLARLNGFRHFPPLTVGRLLDIIHSKQQGIAL